MSAADVTLVAVDGHALEAYVQGPTDGPALVIAQEIFGVNPHIRSVVDRFAEHGFRAIAPALFDRVESEVELAYDQDGMQRGMELRAQVTFEQTLLDVQAAREHVAGEAGPMGVVGFCWGGSIAWLAAARLEVTCAVGYYGMWQHLLEDRPVSPLLLHVGEDDGSIPAEAIDVVRAAHPTIPVHVYAGAGHGFNCDARSAFAPDAAALAMERTLAFLHQHLR